MAGACNLVTKASRGMVYNVPDVRWRHPRPVPVPVPALARIPARFGTAAKARAQNRVRGVYR